MKADARALRDRILGLVDGMGPGEALIRLGRFSHIECMTVSRSGGPPERRGSTRTLVAGELPFGWAKIKLTPVAS